MTLTSALLARLRSRLTAVDDRPEVTPAADYVIVTLYAPMNGARRLAGRAPSEWVDVQIMAVSRSKEGCRQTMSTAVDLLDEWRPNDLSATSPLRRISAGPMLTDGIGHDKRHSLSLILRCSVPYGAALTD